MSHHLIVVTEAMLRRLGKGWHPDELARRVEGHFPKDRGLDGKAVGKWERRFQVPREDYAKILCEEFGAPTLELLGIGRSLESQAYWRPATKAEKDAEVRRRQLLEDSLIAAGAVIVFPVDRLTKWANWYGQAQRVDSKLLGELEQLSTEIARKYAAGATATALPAARAQVYAVSRLLDRAVMTSVQRDRLASIGADAAAMEGVLALNMGDPGEARDAFDLALELVREARDPRLEALVTATETWLWSPGSLGARATGDPQQAVTAMEHACAVGKHASAPTLAWLHAFRARDLGHGQDATGAARARERAQTAAGGIDPGDPGWGFFSLHGELAGFEARQLAVDGDTRLGLGHHADAIGPLQQALDYATMPPIKQSIIGERLVKAWAGAGEPEPACAAGIACLNQADARGFTLGVEKVRDVREAFPPGWSNLDCVRELDERLRALA